mmetsp:Transcript_1216/g.1100  ORF Transcript_1216/g.1100 Transcript_1216/m.1100 type:complete len:188 (-) Transcript_1216:701-1264(-)
MNKNKRNKHMSSHSTDFTPGPGYYEPVGGFKDIKNIKEYSEKIAKLKGEKNSIQPNHSFVSKVQRFNFNKRENEYVPGPGSYNQKSDWGEGKGTKIMKSSSVPEIKIDKTKLKPNFKLPIGEFNLGFEGNKIKKMKFLENLNQKLKFSGLNEDTVGPGQYNINKDKKKGRSTNWHASKTVRELPSLK